MRNWRTCNNRRAERKRSNSIHITIFNQQGALVSCEVVPLPNATTRAEQHYDALHRALHA